MWTKTIERGPYRAHILEEQTMATLERFQREVAPNGAAHDDDPSIYGLRCMYLLVALGVLNWSAALDKEGVAYPVTLPTWPPLDGEEALRSRMASVRGLPVKLVKLISDEVQRTLALDEEEAGN